MEYSQAEMRETLPYFVFLCVWVIISYTTSYTITLYQCANDL